MELSEETIAAVVTAALREDVGDGDLTTEALVPADEHCRAQLLIEEPGVVCGIPVAAAVFKALDPSVSVTVAALGRSGSRHRAGRGRRARRARRARFSRASARRSTWSAGSRGSRR